MALTDLFKSLSHLESYEERQSGEAFVEFVLNNTDIENFKEVVKSYFDKINSYTGDELNEDDKTLVSQYGGLDSNQVLIKTKDEGKTVMIFLWPWGNQQQTTVKLYRLLD